MANPLWPLSLPQNRLRGNNQEKLGNNKLSFKPDSGDTFERTRFTAISDEIQMSFQMTLAQYNIFMDFYKVTLGNGVLDFQFYDISSGTIKDFHITSDPTQAFNGHTNSVVSFSALRRP
jgi:hypothetical protein